MTSSLALHQSAAFTVPAVISTADERTKLRFLEFFAASIRNVNTRKAYARAAVDFMTRCEGRGLVALPQIMPMHVAGWIEEIGRRHSVPTVKLRLAAVRHLFDWMVIGQIMPTNPARTLRAYPISPARGGRRY